MFLHQLICFFDCFASFYIQKILLVIQLVVFVVFGHFGISSVFSGFKQCLSTKHEFRERCAHCCVCEGDD